MKSKFGYKFNHDPWANAYDEDVVDESNPIRAGYDAVLEYIATHAPKHRDAVILEIGIGTGNLAGRLNREVSVVGLDISPRMISIAKQKLADRQNISFVMDDMLTFLEQSRRSYDGIISSYVVHHLTEKEKNVLFSHAWRLLKPGGSALFGDLMFASKIARQEAIDRYKESGHEKIAFDIEDEFFWDVDHATISLKELGFHTSAHQFSDLSWVIQAKKPVNSNT